jgi:hypothetical protein
MRFGLELSKNNLEVTDVLANSNITISTHRFVTS